MSGYRLVIGFVSMLVITIVFVPLYDVFTTATSAFNDITTNATAISYNNMMLALFGFVWIIMLIAISLWVYKGTAETGAETYAGYQ